MCLVWAVSSYEMRHFVRLEAGRHLLDLDDLAALTYETSQPLTDLAKCKMHGIIPQILLLSLNNFLIQSGYLLRRSRAVLISRPGILVELVLPHGAGEQPMKEWRQHTPIHQA
jgi:hypothetical protein